MRRILAGCLLLAIGGAAWGDDPCAGKIAASILTYDRTLRQGAGLLLNQCGSAVRAEILVIAHNRDGYPVARLRTTVLAEAAPLSVLHIDLPFVQSVISLSGYTTEVAAIETLDLAAERTALVTGGSALPPHL
jgi:hypothetical protein